MIRFVELVRSTILLALPIGACYVWVATSIEWADLGRHVSCLAWYGWHDPFGQYFFGFFSVSTLATFPYARVNKSISSVDCAACNPHRRQRRVGQECVERSATAAEEVAHGG